MAGGGSVILLAQSTFAGQHRARSPGVVQLGVNYCLHIGINAAPKQSTHNYFTTRPTDCKINNALRRIMPYKSELRSNTEHKYGDFIRPKYNALCVILYSIQMCGLDALLLHIDVC